MTFRKLLCLIFCSFLHHFSNAQWIQTNGPYGGEVTAIAGDSTQLFVAAFEGGIFRSVNEGQNWTEVNTGLAHRFVTDIVISGSNIFASTSFYGVFMSTNNGATWNAVNNGLASNIVTSLALHGTDLYAGTSAGMYRSVNNGVSWISSTVGLPPVPQILDIQSIGNTIFSLVSSNGIFKSTNNGASWSPCSQNIPNSTFMAVDSNNIVVSASLSNILYKSGDLGANWNQINLPPGHFLERFWLNGAEILGTTYSNNILRSTDTGNTWVVLANTLDNKFVSHYLKSGNFLFGGTTSGGIYRSDDSGINWLQMNHGLNASIITSLAVQDSYIFAGTINDGIYATTDNGNSWTHLTSGAINEGLLELVVKDSFLYAGVANALLRSKDYGLTWDTLNNGLLTGSISAICFDGTDILAGGHYDGISRSINNGVSWSQLFDGNVNALPCTVNSLLKYQNSLIAGTSQGILHSVNNGANWLSSNTGLPVSGSLPQISDLETMDTVVFAALYGSGVYRSTDQGLSWDTSSTGLINLSCLDLHKANTNLYACSQAANDSSVISMSTDNGYTWSDISNGINTGGSLFQQSVNVLKHSATHLIAGSHGHGVYLNASVLTGMAEHKAAISSYRISPNPSVGKISVDSKDILSGIAIYDLNGQCVYKTQLQQNQYTLDLQHLNSGIYAVQVFEKGHLIAVEKIVIQ